MLRMFAWLYMFQMSRSHHLPPTNSKVHRLATTAEAAALDDPAGHHLVAIIVM